MTDFPTKGDDLKIGLRNSERPQFDRTYAQRIKDDRPCVQRRVATSRG